MAESLMIIVKLLDTLGHDYYVSEVDMILAGLILLHCMFGTYWGYIDCCVAWGPFACMILDDNGWMSSICRFHLTTVFGHDLVKQPKRREKFGP